MQREAQTALPTLPFGLLELDAKGTVLYYSPENKGDESAPAPDIVGHNFFTDFEAIAEAKEFQDRINSFRLSHIPAESFSFTLPLDHHQIKARVLLARIREQTDGSSVESILVHIRKA